MTEYVGVTVEREGQKLTLSQPDTVAKLARKFENEIKFLKVFDAPAASGSAVARSKEGEELLNSEGQKRYRSGVGYCG